MSWKADGTQGRGRVTRVWGAGTLAGTWDYRGPVLQGLQPQEAQSLPETIAQAEPGETLPSMYLPDFCR